MPEQDWYTQEEIANMLGVDIKKLYPRVNTLKNAGIIKWKTNPDDQRSILIEKNSLDAIKRAMLA